MELELLHESYCICKLNDTKGINWDEQLLFFSKTDQEISLVCRNEAVPEDTIDIETGYTGFRVKGQLDFALTGILAPIADILAKESIAIFVVSTFDTDYVLVKETSLQKAKIALLNQGYCFIS